MVARDKPASLSSKGSDESCTPQLHIHVCSEKSCLNVLNLKFDHFKSSCEESSSVTATNTAAEHPIKRAQARPSQFYLQVPVEVSSEVEEEMPQEQQQQKQGQQHVSKEDGSTQEVSAAAGSAKVMAKRCQKHPYCPCDLPCSCNRKQAS
jgi:hypothetical protein